MIGDELLPEHSVEAISVSGHTLGHTVYLLDDSILFSGDCLISNGEAGFCFYNFWNADTSRNIMSLKGLQELCAARRMSSIITSHSGVLPTDKVFLNASIFPA